MKTRIVVAALITTVASTFAACNLDSNRDTRVTFELPLLDCTSLQDPLLGGSQMAGTFIAVAGAEFPPITELRRDTNPCANTQVDERKLAELAVSVPAGRKRALAIAIVGQPIALGDLLLPESIDVRGINIRTSEPRPVFFAGGKILEGDVLSQEAPQLALIMEPFVNMLGSVQRGGRGGRAAATIKFMMPDVDGCLATIDTPSDPAIKVVYQITTNANGAFFASAPYRATEGTCKNDETHGNELFALVEGVGGGVALYVPGRALTPGQGMEPGLLLRDTNIYLRDLSDVSPSLVTSVTYIPTSRLVELHVAGYGLPSTPGGRALLEVQELPSGAAQMIEFEAGTPIELGAGGLFGPMPSYQRVRLFGDRKPFSMKLSTSHGFANGKHRVTLPDGTPFVFRVGGAQ